MRDDPSGRAGVSRRGLLRALAVVPAALAGCTASRAERPAAAGAAPVLPAAPPAALSPGAPSAIRALALPADAEPAFVFRAAASRPADSK